MKHPLQPSVCTAVVKMSRPCEVHIGVDVGGTNTDAVVLRAGAVIGWAKHVTTADVTTGVGQAIKEALDNALTYSKGMHR